LGSGDVKILNRASEKNVA